MNIERIMNRFYQHQLSTLPDVERLPVRTPSEENPAVRRGLSLWENALGAAVTGGWLLELLLPERWFLIGRIASVFRIGF
ncbi:hypothetical protein JW777_02825 [bacterium]|nr:hypothetical protein [bacterium]